MGDTPTTIELLGKAESIAIPTDYALLEELFAAANGSTGTRLLRAYAAMIGLCCPAVGRMCRASYSAHGYDAIGYGRQVYSWLHEQKVTIAEVSAAGAVLYPAVIMAAFPRDPEVADALGK
jgi:hypothetical protein